MIVYLYDDAGYYLGDGESIPHPFGLGEDTLPNNSTTLEVLEPKEGYNVRFIQADEELPARWKYEKILSVEEQKIAGEIPLDAGEYLVDGVLTTVEAPSILHTWVDETNEWILDQAKFDRMKVEFYGLVSCKREDTLEAGNYFEPEKLIKGREKDLTRSLAIYTSFRDGLIPLTNGVASVIWQFSNGTYEVVSELSRITAIYTAISSFISTTCNIDGQVKMKLHTITDFNELINFDVDTEWQTIELAMQGIAEPVEEPVV